MFSILDHFQEEMKHILDNTGMQLLEVQHDHLVWLPAILINEQLPETIQRNKLSTQLVIVKRDHVAVTSSKIKKYKMLFQMLYRHVQVHEI